MNSPSPFKDYEFSPSRSEEETVGHLPWRGRSGLRRGCQVNPSGFSPADSLVCVSILTMVVLPESGSSCCLMRS